jgi:hypothetical protein
VRRPFARLLVPLVVEVFGSELRSTGDVSGMWFGRFSVGMSGDAVVRLKYLMKMGFLESILKLDGLVLRLSGAVLTFDDTEVVSRPCPPLCSCPTRLTYCLRSSTSRCISCKLLFDPA